MACERFKPQNKTGSRWERPVVSVREELYFTVIVPNAEGFKWS